MRVAKSLYGVLAGMLGLMTGASMAAPMPSLLLTGRVEYVNSTEGILYVLGHKIHSGDARRVVQGQLVNVYGVASTDGTISGAQIESVSSYAVGTDQLFVRGVITAVDEAAGLVYVGSTAVPVSQITAQGAAPRVGNAIGVFGTQDTASSPFVVRGAILSGSGEKEAILSGSGEQAAILSGSGASRAQILSGSGVQATILSGSGEQAAILSGSGEQAAILSGSGEKEAILSGSGDSIQ
jgi:hypothetical protein